MKKLLILTSALLLTGSAFAENDPLWMRYPAISPNGEMIAFTYKGDIYTVPTTGGKATQLTTHPAHDTRPVWSPDGKQIAFASDRNGNFDVFIMNKEGGAPTQLTVHSANEYPETFSDNDHVLYSASIQQDVKDSQFPSSLFAQIYQVGTQGGRPELFSSLAMENLAFSKDGKQVLYNDFKDMKIPGANTTNPPLPAISGYVHWIMTVHSKRLPLSVEKTAIRYGRRTEMPFTI